MRQRATSLRRRTVDFRRPRSLRMKIFSPRVRFGVVQGVPWPRRPANGPRAEHSWSTERARRKARTCVARADAMRAPCVRECFVLSVRAPYMPVGAPETLTAEIGRPQSREVRGGSVLLRLHTSRGAKRRSLSALRSSAGSAVSVSGTRAHGVLEKDRTSAGAPDGARRRARDAHHAASRAYATSRFSDSPPARTRRDDRPRSGSRGRA